MVSNLQLAGEVYATFYGIGKPKGQKSDVGFEVMAPSKRCCVVETLSWITAIATLAIGILGVTGAFPGAAMGWTAVGLGGASLVASLAAGNFKTRKIDLAFSAVFAATLITVGALGGAGVLSASQVSWGVLGTSLAAIPMFCYYQCGKIGERQLNKGDKTSVYEQEAQSYQSRRQVRMEQHTRSRRRRRRVRTQQTTQQNSDD